MSLFKFAENILNNLDQTAQSSIKTALNKTTNEQKKSSKHSRNLSSNAQLTSNSSSKLIEKSNEEQLSLPLTSVSASASTANLKSINSTASLDYKNSSAKTSFSNFESWKNKNKEDELINFLNSSQSSDQPKESRLKDNVNSEDTNQVEFAIGDNSLRQAKRSETNDEQKLEEQVEEENLNEASQNKSSDSGQLTEFNENKLLKNEIVSLNQEIKSLTKRIKTAQDEFQRSKRKADHFQSQISESDKIIRELRAREEDMIESIKSKDSQLAILRVRFEESDKELKSKQKEIQTVRNESERILKDHSNSSDIQSQAFETLKEKLKDLEQSLQREKEAYTQAQNDHFSMQSKLEIERQTLTELLQSNEKKLNDEKVKNSELNAQLKNTKTSNNHLKQELEEYKQKATKTLQAKDRIIASLKENATSLGGGSSGENEGNEGDYSGSAKLNSLKSIEIEELRNERDYLKDELNSKTTSLELLRAEMMELDTQTSMEIEQLKDQIRNLVESQDEEKKSKNFLEQDLKNIRQQLEFSQDELYKQKSVLNNRIQERETEIERLRSQLTTKNLGTTTEKELENRLHVLTENLIQKQTLIEALQSEKHSIFLQLERSEKRLHDYESIVSSKKNAISIRMNDEEDTSTNKLPYFRESPYDHEVTRKVKRAATEIDKFSIRLGVFLKKYPIARIFVIFYMILLHLWVLIVLFTYKPEAHTLEYNASILPQHP